MVPRIQRHWSALVGMLFVAACLLATTCVDAAGERAEDRGRPDSAATSRAGGRPGSAADRISPKERIDVLIRRLGSPRYSERRAAANELNQIGPEAFDQLQAATDSTDPEIAASARYLLRQINVEWTRRDDPLFVRRLMRDYADQDESYRREIVQAFGRLREGDGVAALCRIIRFDRSPLVSREAAAAIIHPPVEAADRTIDSEIFDRELGDSTRIGSQWLRQYQLQLQDPAAAVDGWKWFVDDETHRQEEGSDDTSALVVSALLWNLADVHQRAGNTAPLVAALDRVIEFHGEATEAAVGEALQWLREWEAWEALNQFASQYDERIDRSKTSLYLLAVARAAMGHDEAAGELVGKARDLAAKNDLEGIRAGQILAELGYFDWAEQEFRHILESESLKSPEGVAACTLLSKLLQDGQQYEEAADVIKPLMELLDEDSGFVGRYQRYAEPFQLLDIVHLSVEEVHAHYHFMRACQFEQQGDYAKQREQLLQAIEQNDQDADVLIAMYHAKEANESWREATLKRINELTDVIEERIEDNQQSATLYNHWAWLVANTEGDFRKAVRYSRRSLELAPNESSLLDTLGRCYFAAGDLENAIKMQRRAVRFPSSNLQVMRRQLDEFERAQAAKQGAGAGGQESRNAE